MASLAAVEYEQPVDTFQDLVDRGIYLPLLRGTLKKGLPTYSALKCNCFSRHLRSYFGSKLFLPGDKTSGNQTLWHVQPARGTLWERLERKSSLVRRPFLNVYVNLIQKLNFRYNKPDYPWTVGREPPPFPPGPREGPVGHDGVPLQAQAPTQRKVRLTSGCPARRGHLPGKKRKTKKKTTLICSTFFCNWKTKTNIFRK